MSSPPSTQGANITNILATELFKRGASSMGMGAIGVAIMFFIHWDAADWQQPAAWATGMLAVFVVRAVVAQHGLATATKGRDPIRLVNLQACLCAMTGLGWGSTIYLFDNAVMDQKFNIRLIIIAAAMAFTVSSMAVFKRVFIPYLLALAVPVLAFLVSHDYVRSWNFLLPSGVFYIGMIAFVSNNTNRHIRHAASDHLQVLVLTEKLTQVLATEKQLRAELDIRADTDDLTGIFNRRGLLKQLGIELARCRRFPRSAAVLMLDIDHFKQVNDSHRHAGGDIAIQAVVAAVQKQLRDTDIFGRLGGEEFLLLLPALEQAAAVAVAERVRACIERTSVALPGGAVRITVSIGVAVYADQDDTDCLLARADGALYAAKRGGRNRVEADVFASQV